LLPACGDVGFDFLDFCGDFMGNVRGVRLRTVEFARVRSKTAAVRAARYEPHRPHGSHATAARLEAVRGCYDSALRLHFKETVEDMADVGGNLGAEALDALIDREQPIPELATRQRVLSTVPCPRAGTVDPRANFSWCLWRYPRASRRQPVQCGFGIGLQIRRRVRMGGVAHQLSQELMAAFVDDGGGVGCLNSRRIGLMFRRQVIAAGALLGLSLMPPWAACSSSNCWRVTALRFCRGFRCPWDRTRRSCDYFSSAARAASR